MSNPDETTSPSSHLFAVGIGCYDEGHVPLDSVVEVTQKLVDVLVGGGYTQGPAELIADRVEQKTVTRAVKSWFPDREAGEEVLVYWTGHGVRSVTADHLLAVSDTPERPLIDEAIDPKLLFERLLFSNASDGLLIIDTCFSGTAGIVANEVMAKAKRSQVPDPARVGRRIAVFTSSHPSRTVTSPVFGSALVKVLSDPESGAASWGRSDRRIGLGALREALDAEIEASAGVHLDLQVWEARPTGWASDDSGGTNWILNPVGVGGSPDELVELRRALMAVATTGEHWDVSHRGLEVGSSGWAFVGRTETLKRIVKWLESAPTGVAVVTGPPGSGKSAVLGRLVALSVEAYRERAKLAEVLRDVPAQTLPPVGVFDVAVHALGKTRLDVVVRLSEVFGVGRDKEARTDTNALSRALLDHLEALPSGEGPVTIAVDALDEAQRGHHMPIAQLCHQLGKIDGVRVLIGVRYSLSGEPVPAGEPKHGRLRDAFPGAMLIDVSGDPDTEADIADYVDARLAERHVDATRRKVTAMQVAEKAVKDEGLWLYARIVARTLQEASDLPDAEDLPAEATAAFAQDLLARFGDDLERINDLLGAAAWAHGSGFPKAVWAEVASALSSTGAVYGLGDVNEVLRRAGAHVIESAEDGKSVYRLGHKLLNEHYKGDVDRYPEVATAVFESVVVAGGWGQASDYAVRHFAMHLLFAIHSPTASAWGTGPLARFYALFYATSPAWLHRAIRLVGLDPVLGLLTIAATRHYEAVTVFRAVRSSRVALARDPDQLAAQLHARLSGGGLDRLIKDVADVAPGVWLRSRGKVLRWRTDLATTYTVVGTVGALAFGNVGSGPILGIGVDNKVMLWNPLRGDAKQDVIRVDAGAVSALALAEIDGRPVAVVAAGQTGTVTIVDILEQKLIGPIFQTDRIVESVALGRLGGTSVVGAVGGGRLWVWEWKRGERVADLAVFPPEREAVGVATVRNELVVNLVSRGVALDSRRDGPRGFEMRFCNPLSGVPIWPDAWHLGVPFAFASSETEGRPLVAALVRMSDSDSFSLAIFRSNDSTSGGRRLSGAHIGIVGDRRGPIAVGEVEGKVVGAYAPRYQGSGFVQLIEGDVKTPEALSEECEYLDGRTYLPSSGAIWAVCEGAEGSVRVLVSEPELRLLDVRIGSSDAVVIDEELTPDGVADMVAGDLSLTFSTLDDGSAQPLGLADDDSPHSEAALPGTQRLRVDEPSDWPRTAEHRGVVADQAVLATGSVGGAVWIWNLADGARIAGPFADIPGEGLSPDDLTVEVTSLALGRVDGRDVVAVVVDGRVAVYDMKTGSSRPAPCTPTSIVVAVAIGLLNGRPVIVTGSKGGVLALWEANSGRRIAGITLDSEILSVWTVRGADAIAACAGGGLLVFDVVDSALG